MSFFRRNIDEMSAYVPGEQPPAGTRVVKLNTNENPYPPSPEAMAVLRDFDPDLLRRYPDPLAKAFRGAVGGVLGFPQEWILPGNGSDEVLAMLVHALAGEGDVVSFATPTYVLYETMAHMQDAHLVTVPFDESYKLPIDALAKARAKVTFVANPNSPSGTASSPEELRELAGRLKGVLVIDEAYGDFASFNCLDLAREMPNVIVLRTFSKSYSLAGLRLGFGVANPDLLEGLWKVKDSYNLDALTQAVGLAAMADQEHMRANARRIIASRAKLAGDLAERGFQVWPSQSNFLLARVPGGDGKGLYAALKARGVLVRYFHQEQMYDKLRITVGTDPQNDALLAAIDGRGAGNA